LSHLLIVHIMTTYHKDLSSKFRISFPLIQPSHGRPLLSIWPLNFLWYFCMISCLRQLIILQLT
jgi:hypothetical protein